MFLKKSNSFLEIIEVIMELSHKKIKGMVYEAIFSRGKNYFNKGYVLSVNEIDTQNITIKVKGNYADSYRVKLSLDVNSLRANCNCEYNNICKHIVASLLAVQDTFLSQKSSTSSKNNAFIEYLNGLSKEELFELVVKFAPTNFKKEIALKKGTQNELKIYLNIIESEIFSDLSDEELLHNPEGFQKSISEHLEKLSSFVNSANNRVFKIIFTMVKEIEKKEEEGYLYNDYYRYKECFEYDILSNEIITLINKIEDKKVQIEIFVDFIKVVEASDYVPLSYEKLEIKDKKLLSEHIYDIHNLPFYYYIREFLLFEEKEKFLQSFKDPLHSFSNLIDLYVNEGQKEVALEYVEHLLSTSLKIEYIEKILEFRDVSLEELKSYIYFAIKDSVSRNFNFIMQNMAKFEDRTEFEIALYKESVNYYYIYLEKEKRVKEMFLILSELPLKKESFFHHYKKAYPMDARLFYEKEIRQNLKTTGDNYYEKIEKYLSHLKEIISKEDFDSKIQGLRDNYKRRINFMKRLKRF